MGSLEIAEIIDELRAEVGDGPTDAELEAYATQVSRLRDAARRVESEGLIISDSKGQPLPHPALEIERAAQAEVRLWAARCPPRSTPGA